MNKNSKSGYMLLAGGGLLLGAGVASATDVLATDIITTVNSGFQLVAAACVTIATFFGVYRLVKRIR